MAAKKTAGKTTGSTAKKSAKKSTKKGAKKSAKKSAKKAEKKAAEKPTAKTAGKKKAAAKKPASQSSATQEKAAKPRAKSGFSSLAVNMGHVFALRPKVGTSFRPDDFRAARQQLEGESYETAAAAAQAVVEKTLELSRGDANPLRNKHHKRF